MIGGYIVQTPSFEKKNINVFLVAAHAHHLVVVIVIVHHQVVIVAVPRKDVI